MQRPARDRCILPLAAIAGAAARVASAERIVNDHETFAIFIVEQTSSIKNSVINKELRHQ
jgi:hypothetical protein